MLSEDDILERLSFINFTKSGCSGNDLIYGLPGQSLKLWEKDLETLLDGKQLVDGCSIYQLNLFPGTPITEKIKNGILSPPADLREQADFFTLSNKVMKEQLAERASLRHWKFSKRERSIYNTFSKYGYTCNPCRLRSRRKYWEVQGDAGNES